MASLNSLMECLVISHTSLGSQSLTNHRRKQVNCGGMLTFMDLNSGKSSRRSSFCKQVSINGRNREGLLRMRRVKATASDCNEGEDGSDTEDAIQATLEKSKKVLAMQKELLQQIAERRKLVSSIKSSIINPDNELTDRAGDKSSSEVDLGENLPGVSKGFESSIASGSEISSISSKARNDKFPVIPAGTQEGRKQQVNAHSKTLNLESSVPNEVRTRLPEKARAHLDGTPNGGNTGTPTRNKQPVKMSSGTVRAGVPKKTSDQYDGRSDIRESKTTDSLSHEKPVSDMKLSRKTDSGTTLADFLTKSNKPFSNEDQGAKLPISKELSDSVAKPISEDSKPPPLAGPNVMNVILVAAECAHWVKTGGLGDVAGALPKALARRGHRVMVVVPRYGEYPEPQDIGVRKRYKVAGQDTEVNYYQTFIDGVDFVFIDAPMFRHLGNNIYGGSRLDILKRMILFCKVAVEVPWHVPCGGVCYGDGNLVFIANDWHTAMLPVYLKAYYRDNGLMTFTRSVLVIHNLAHQGRGPVDDFSYVDLPPHYIDYFKMYDPVGGEHFNIFAAGLKAADRIVTVSDGYAWEVKTLEGGWGLHGVLNENDWKLRGIVNGIDTKEWSPQVDVHLKSDGYTNYSLETLKSGKAQCKEALQRELGLPVRDDVPLIGFIGRLDHQKGVDLIAQAIPWLVEQDVQLVMLGTGREDLEQMLRQFESQYHDKIRGWVGFCVKTAHRITAGADILLMPSRFEPCGLNQLYAMSYGTIPVVHAVGGLRDTVHPFDPYNNTGLGWTFDRADAERLIHALGNCLYTYRDYKDSWEGLQIRGMSQDLSWDHAAQLYEEVLIAAKYQW